MGFLASILWNSKAEKPKGIITILLTKIITVIIMAMIIMVKKVTITVIVCFIASAKRARSSDCDVASSASLTRCAQLDLSSF